MIKLSFRRANQSAHKHIGQSQPAFIQVGYRTVTEHILKKEHLFDEQFDKVTNIEDYVNSTLWLQKLLA